MEGLNTCRMHPGRDGKVKHAAAVALRKRRFEPVPTHPAQALLDEVNHWAGICAYVDRLVEGLQEGEMVWGMVSRATATGGQFPGATVIEEAKLHALVRWQAEAHRELRNSAQVAMQFEAAAMLLRISQATGMALVRRLDDLLTDVGLSPEQWDRARAGLPGLFKAMTGAENVGG